MSNTYLSTTKSPHYTELKRGDIVSALGQIAVVCDTLHSQETGNVCLYIMFVHNIGNSRLYDVLELTPERAIALGVDRWTMATSEDLSEAIEKRKRSIEGSFHALRTLAGLPEDVDPEELTAKDAQAITQAARLAKLGLPKREFQGAPNGQWVILSAIIDGAFQGEARESFTVKDIVKRTGAKDNTASGALKTLVRKNWLIERTKPGGMNKIYTLTENATAWIKENQALLVDEGMITSACHQRSETIKVESITQMFRDEEKQHGQRIH